MRKTSIEFLSSDEDDQPEIRALGCSKFFSASSYDLSMQELKEISHQLFRVPPEAIEEIEMETQRGIWARWSVLADGSLVYATGPHATIPGRTHPTFAMNDIEEYARSMRFLLAESGRRTKSAG